MTGNTPTQVWLGNEGLRRADLRADMRFLDVAAGSGALSIPAARLGAWVLSTDVSPAMLEHLDARARQEGLNIDTRVMDGHALELEDNTFDVAGSQFGVMLFPDMPKGISEMARVVKPGGRVLMNVYGDPHEIEFFSFFVQAIQTVVPSFEGPRWILFRCPSSSKTPRGCDVNSQRPNSRISRWRRSPRRPGSSPESTSGTGWCIATRSSEWFSAS